MNIMQKDYKARIGAQLKFEKGVIKYEDTYLGYLLDEPCKYTSNLHMGNVSFEISDRRII